jgi:hypothetical protein
MEKSNAFSPDSPLCLRDDAITGKPFDYLAGGRIDLQSDLDRDPETQWVSPTTPGIIYKYLYIVGGRTAESLPRRR